MSTAKMVFHGSDIEKICEVYQLKPEEIVKFGANVNPLGLSEHVKEQLAGRLDILSSYPDRDYTSLRSTISEYCNIPAEFILPGNGSSELIALLIQERNPKHTLILGPTYSEYSRELSFSGSTQEYYHLHEEDNFVLDVDDFCRTLDGKYDFLILCNPNNPTSSAISIYDLRRIVSFCNERNIFVMIDEKAHARLVAKLTENLATAGDGGGNDDGVGVGVGVGDNGEHNGGHASIASEDSALAEYGPELAKRV